MTKQLSGRGRPQPGVGEDPRPRRAGGGRALGPAAGLVLVLVASPALVGPCTAGADPAPPAAAPRLNPAWPLLLPACRGGLGTMERELFLSFPGGGDQPPIPGSAADLPPCSGLETLDPPARPDSLDVLHYDIHVRRIDESTRTLTATTRVRLRTLRALSAVDLDLAGVVADGVRSGSFGAPDAPLSFTHTDGLLHVRFPAPVAPFTVLDLSVSYSGSPDCGSGSAGLVFTPRGTQTFSEPTYARHWFPGHDAPWDKATASITVDVPAGREASATGRLAGAEPFEGGRRMTWVMEEPVATYLLAFYTGDFVRIEDRPAGGVSIEYFTYPDIRGKTAVDLANTPAMIEFYSRFHPYPFSRYAQTIGVFGGGMENQANSLIGERLLTGDREYEWLVAHEAAHQWWGDLVTPRAWRDIWLNEGFATYFDLLFTEHRYGDAAFRERIGAMQGTYIWGDSLMQARGLPRDVILDLAPHRQFSFVVYNKGASVLHMLRGVNALREFTWGLRENGTGRIDDVDKLQRLFDPWYFSIFERYAERHAYGTASVAEFRAVCEEVMGEDLGWFFHPWLYYPGHPVLAWDWAVEPAGESSRVTVIVEQRQEGAPLFRMPLHFRYYGPRLRSFDDVRWIEGRRHVWTRDVPGAVTEVELDPRDWLLDEHVRVPLLPLPPPLALRFGRNPTSGLTDFFVRSSATGGGDGTIEIFDLRGRLAARAAVALPEGAEVTWTWSGRLADGRPAAAGVYFVRLSAGGGQITRRLVVAG